VRVPDTRGPVAPHRVMFMLILLFALLGAVGAYVAMGP
jgi:hypothetical protein